jgi:lipid-binding SYLF domain-containing protein
MDAGRASGVDHATVQSDVYAFIYGQEGLMAGLGLEGPSIKNTPLDTGNCIGPSRQFP